MPTADLERARALMNEALRLCDAHGEGLVAARLQLALDTRFEEELPDRLREEGRPWRTSD